MTSDSFRSSEQLMTSLDERPYILFSNQSDKTEKLLKTSMKELNDCLIQHQRRSTNKLQELYVNQFDEEQIWSQIRSNDNVINSKTEDLISSILANIEEVTLLPSQLAVMERKPKKKTAYDEEAWAEGQEGEGEEEGPEDEEGAEGYEEGEEGEEGMEEEMGREDGDDTDEEAELREFEQLDRYLENEQIGLDDEDVEGEEGEEGLGEYMEGYGEDDEDDDDEDVKEKKLRKYRLVEEEEDDEEGGRPEIDDAEVEDDVFDRAREDLLGGDDEEEAEERPKKRDAKTSEIDALEERLLQKKLWQTTGEVKAGQRPMNSLLEENLDFNITKKGTSIVTPEYSAKLEDIIKQRILDEAWDDPIQYAPDRPIKETFSNLQELNFEKTEGGLAKEYEEKYKKDIMGMKTTGPEDDLKKEIDILFKQISYNLDVLSNLSFTPKATFEQTKIVPNVASINLEEKTPLSFSKSHAKAPQELFNPNKAVFKTKEELTTAENKASRRAFKRNLRTRNKEKKKKDLIKKLEFKGQTKYEHNLQQKGLAKYKSEVNKKNQKSVTFTKSSQFFDNLEKSKKPKGKGEKEESESLNVKRKNYMM